MIRNTHQAVLIALAMILTQYITAQTTPTSQKEQGYYTLGFNGGIAYQQSDVLTDLSGLGFGLTYGKNLIYSPTAPFSVDVRSRFQIARSFGKDIRPSYGILNNEALNGTKNLDYTGEGKGYVYANHKTNLAEVGMEGVFTLNQLREKTGIGLTLTGGVGLAWYKASIDQRDAAGLYDVKYESLDEGGSRSYSSAQLDAFRDGKYETLADGFGGAGKFGIMPSIGFEFDYNLTPDLAIGLGHRMTFSGTDLLDGQQWTDANNLTGNNDILHYTSLGLKYTLGNKQSLKKNKLPVIELVEPYSNDLKMKKANIALKAKVNRVENPFDVYLTVNGKEQSFNFNNQHIITNIRLKSGKNTVKITANNEAGRIERDFQFFYEAPSELLTEIEEFGKPEINFTNPAYDDIKVSNSTLAMRAKVRMVNAKKDIELRVNGKKKSFDFEEGIEVIEATLALREGKNTIEIKAKNRNGEQRLSRTVIYEQPLARPTISFNEPAYNGKRVENRSIAVRANITDVKYSADIRMKLNGRSVVDFYYNKESGLLKTELSLREGNNELEIIAKNRSGEARKTRSIIYERPYVPVPVVRAPRVNINAPRYQESTTREEMVTVHATLENIFSKSAIRMSNNGRNIYDFDFNPNTGVLRHNLYLREGINRLLIEAENESGRDGAAVTINFELPYPPPPPPVVAVPFIDFRKPRHQAIFEEREITVKANIEGILSARDIEFRVNRENCLDFNYNPSNGVFRAKINLQEGENYIVIKAQNPAGINQEKVIVYHERPYAPAIDIRQPNVDQTEKEEITFKAKIEHVDNVRDIRLLLNEREVRNFRFRGERIEAKLRLKEGQNEIEVIAENKYGRERKRLYIDYFIPQPPSVQFVEVSDNQTFRKEKVTLKAIVEHVEEKDALRFFVNGRATSNFKLEGNQFTSKVVLREGQNTILLRARTDNGSTSANLRINYLKPRRPSIAFLSHEDEAKLEESNITLKVRLKNVENRTEITLNINDKKQSVFTYRDGVLKTPIRLEKGANEIVLKAHTASGGEVESKLMLYYEPSIAAPTLKVLSPTKIGLSTQHMTSRIQVAIQNISYRSELQLLINGTATKAFDFDEKTNTLSASIPLKIGLNKIKIVAENDGGKAESVIKITRRTGYPSISKGHKVGRKDLVKKG